MTAEPPPTTFAGLQHLPAAAEDIACVETLTLRLDATVAAHRGLADPVSRSRGRADTAGDMVGEGEREAIVALLKKTYDASRERVRAMLLERPAAGLRIARAFSHATDVIVAGTVHYVLTYLHPAPVRTKAERLSVVAVGGYGRGEMAPFSDVDLLFLTPYKRTPWAESVVESVLYLLWDLRLKLGQSTRSIADCMRYAGEDWTIRTNLLEMRLIAGDPEPYETLHTRLWDELFLKTGPQFVAAKLRERDNRHQRHGGSRYLLEPNVKEAKGGLRDLQTLHWISRYLYRVDKAWELCPLGVFEEDEVRRFADAAKFVWAVRHHLHDVTGRATEVLTFDRQVEIAERMGYRDATGRRAVEHFMHRYFRHAKDVGDLTRIFSAALELQHAKARPRFSSLLRAMSMKGPDHGDSLFQVRDGRLALSEEDLFCREPIAILKLFREAARLDARIHPAAMRSVTRHLDLIDEHLRQTPEAGALFLELLTDRENGEWLMQLMNETGVLGRFVPEFGRVVAMMQFNMYHHYTVDAHTLETLRHLARIERGEESEAHPVASEIARQDVNRRALYVALLCHDLGKGRLEDHSVVGAEIAAEVASRMGLADDEVELVVWLVRHHLLMSDVAQKRDIADPVTVRDFARIVQSPERLRLLLILTICDIRGVGPGVWNNWKAQLLRKLYWDTRAFLTGGGDDISSRAARIREAKTALGERLAAVGWTPEAAEVEAERHYPQYWLGLDTGDHAVFAALARQAEERAPSAGLPAAAGAEPEGQFLTRFEPDPARDATRAALYMDDHPGLFSRMAGAFAIAGANVVDARSYTTNDGMTCAMFWVQDSEGAPYEQARLPRLARTIERTLAGEVVAREAIAERQRDRARERPFTVPTQVVFDNEASELYTVIEVNARDRLGLLHALARGLAQQSVNIFTAIIATYGERAVDVFYVKDVFGLKISSAAKQRTIAEALRAAIAASGGEEAGAAGDAPSFQADDRL
ncbi:MAG: [protein-PII] uridylyltransferase [Pseudomonadota bacterium]